MVDGSRIPGFYKLSLDERRRAISERAELDLDELLAALDTGGLDPATADKVVENVLGTYGLPFGVALNVRINGVDRLVPMVVEEPSVVAAASNAARMIREGGGFEAEMAESLMIAQVELLAVPDLENARLAIREHRAEILALAAQAVPGLVGYGGGPRDLEVRTLGDDHLVVHVLVDCQNAMGANLANSVAEGVGPRLAELSGARLGLRILSNLCDRRRVRVRCRVPATSLALSRSGARPIDAVAVDELDIVDAIASASRFAERDPYRAATHNKGIMNGVDSVVIATGNDYRAVEAGAHAYAARSGRYAPLATWRRDGDALVGELEMPLALGIVGGTLRVHPTARLALRLARVESADDLALIAASAGLASNLAALRALATEGIQRGHMALHARSVAIAAGAKGTEVEMVAQRIAERREITLESAISVLQAVRAGTAEEAGAS
jgi:hydroxymethylglutaryl-CoA reductase